MFWSFRGYLGKIKSEKKNSIYNIYIYYILHVQCCVRVSASNFQVLTRKSGGARALGNIARFLAGPARSRTTNAESYQEFSLHWIISRNLLALNHIKKFPETESYQGFSLHWTTPRTFLTLNHIKKFPCTESHQEISLHWIISRNFPTLNHIKKFPYTASHQEICLHCITSRNFLRVLCSPGTFFSLFLGIVPRALQPRGSFAISAESRIAPWIITPLDNQQPTNNTRQRATVKI